MPFQNGRGRGDLTKIDGNYNQNKGMQLTVKLWMTSQFDVIKV
jgi:hypothetical protein